MSHINVLRSALTEVQAGLTRTKYPDIVFPKFVHINSQGSELADEILSFSSDVTGDLDTGLISMNTSVFDQVGVTFNHKNTVGYLVEISGMARIRTQKSGGIRRGSEH